MIGRTVSHYEILEKLGAGGMGVVYKARDTKLERIVALKFLAGNLLDSTTARVRFEQEARAISALNHPNIAIVYEADESDGDAFLVLEYLPGGTLRSRLMELRENSRKLSIAQVVDLSLQLAEGLAHAHQRQVLHRDIKPGNLMFNADGIMKITDFGLSKFLTGPDLTKGGARMGTVPYMSPEQARGVETDHRSDLFSAGAVLFEMAASHCPFHAPDEASLVRQIVKADPPSLAKLRPDAPESLLAIVRHLLEKNPKKRYQSAGDLALDLRAVQREIEGPTGSLASHRIPAYASKPMVRRPIVWLLAVCALLAILAVAFAPKLRRLTGLTVPSRKHIAVLQFENIGGDPANGAFCEGLAETLTSSLTELEHFHGSLLVVPASEVRKQNIRSAADARRAFNVNLVITGSVQRTEGTIRLHANLVDTKSGTQIDARSIVASLDELNNLQDQVVREVADVLELQLQPKAVQLLSAGKTSNASAYDLYLQARGYLDRYDKPGNLDHSIDLLMKAVGQDPRYAVAFAALSEAKWWKYGTDRDPKWLEEAQELGLRAIELDKQVPAAHTNLAKAYAYTGRHADAIREYQAALDLDPISVEAHRGLADVYQRSGKPKEAERVYREAIQLRPGDWLSHTMLGVFYYEQSRYTDAEPPFQRVVELTPDNYVAWYNLGALHLALGKYDQAASEFNKSIDLKAGPSFGGYLGLAEVYLAQGRYRESAETDEKALAIGPNSYAVAGNLAEAYQQVPELAQKAPGMFQRAIENADRALITNPKDALALGCRALYCAKIGNLKQANEDIRRARAMAPADARLIYNAALIQEIAHHRQSALKGLAEALRAGFSLAEMNREPELANLRRDPLFDRLTKNQE
ncbi:MAG TPA: protein kinase [Bryobacteraceae bacterium]|nr:protein kinase [Bryobacteraceae bacterium]